MLEDTDNVPALVVANDPDNDGDIIGDIEPLYTFDCTPDIPIVEDGIRIPTVAVADFPDNKIAIKSVDDPNDVVADNPDNVTLTEPPELNIKFNSDPWINPNFSNRPDTPNTVGAVGNVTVIEL